MALPHEGTPLTVLVIDVVTAVSDASRNLRGDVDDSTRHQRIPVSVSMDLSRHGNASGTVDIRNLPTLP